MAKKGGLGRGLNSLLGDETEMVRPREEAPAERKPVEAKPAEAKPVESKPVENKPAEPAAAPKQEHPRQEIPRQESPRQEAPAKPRQEASSESRNAEQSAKKELETNKELDMINEDKVTIKGVVERPAARPVVQKLTEERKAKETRREIEKGSESDLETLVAIDKVHPNPNQPRTNFNKEELEELAESIKRNGLLQPPIVRERNGEYEIIAGERRWQASNLAGLKEIPVRILDVDDDEAIVLALIENIQRSDLNPIEEAYGYRRMMERGKMTQSQVAQAVSKGRSTIANALRLLELPEDAQQLLFEEKITAGHARAILSVPTTEGRSKLTKKIVDEQLSVRETEAIARLMSGKKEEKAPERPKTPKSYKTVARSLRDTLQTDVRVKSVKGKNKIEISFKDEADLERLFRLITE